MDYALLAATALGAIGLYLMLPRERAPLARLGALLGVMAIAWVVLTIAPRIAARLGQTGLNVVTRIMGLLVMVIGVQFIIEGIRTVAVDVLRLS